MTALLLEKKLSVSAFEIDAGFVRILKRIFSGDKNFNLVEGDVMKTWRLYSGDSGSQKAAPYLFGNLPYNVAAALLADLIENIPALGGCLFDRIVVTVQKEVALRMAASAGSQDYSSFSVLCASAYRVKPLMLIRPSSFYPQPNVDSMAILMEKSDHLSAKSRINPQIFYPLVRSLFASRRKTIKNNLINFIASRMENFSSGSSSQDVCTAVLAENGLGGKERAEELPPDLFVSLAKTIENMRK
jgi:16S rRNA (adenine1518-N6/adenine1519-N6)-dimethyltransferase